MEDHARVVLEQAIVRELARVLEKNPHFSPLVELAAERERVLGEGGMGIVHLVLDRRLGRRAALKLLKSGGDARTVSRFRREAEITARLDHPGIPPVYEAGSTSRGESFLLMRFVSGASLEAVLRREEERPDERSLVETLARVGEAVAYAHSRGIVHRDLKPANVMVGSFGEVLVMDWGIARDLSEQAESDRALELGDEVPTDAPAGLTQAGSLMGTLGYMPPEQALGEDVDARADVFALGAMLTEVLTGTLPIQGDTNVNRLMATARGEIARPRELRPGCPPELDAIAARALAEKRDDRYPDVPAFVADLRAWLEGRPVSVYEYGAAERARLFVRAHPTLVAGTVIALLGASGAAALLAVKNRDLTRTLAALEAETQRRAAAEADRSRELEAQVLLSDVWYALRTGQPQAKIREKLYRVLELSATEDVALRVADELKRAGDRDGSIRVLRRAADAHQPGYRTLFRLANAAFEQTRDPKPQLEELLARAKARGEENLHTELARTWLMTFAKDFEGARRGADRAVEKAPQEPTPYFLRACVLAESGDLDGAVVDLERVQRLEPPNVGTLVMLGDVHTNRKDWAAASAAYGRAIELEPTMAMPSARRARTRLRMGQAREALLDAERALEIEPESSEGFLLRGRARSALGDVPGAIADLERYLQLAPNGLEAAGARKSLEKLRAR